MNYFLNNVIITMILFIISVYLNKYQFSFVLFRFFYDKVLVIAPFNHYYYYFYLVLLIFIYFSQIISNQY